MIENRVSRFEVTGTPIFASPRGGALLTALNHLSFPRGLRRRPAGEGPPARRVDRHLAAALQNESAIPPPCAHIRETTSPHLSACDLLALDVRANEHYLDWSGFGHAFQPCCWMEFRPLNAKVSHLKTFGSP